MAKITKWACEAMLLNWSETANGGAKVVLQLADVEDLEAFKALTMAKGKRAGQRLGCAFAVIGETEELMPVEVPEKGAKRGGGHFPAGLLGLAVKWCNEEHFREWLEKEYPGEWLEFEDAPDYEERAKDVLCRILSINSRKEIDSDPKVRAEFERLIRQPYMEARAKDGL